jgi:hypothetical protein
LCSGIRRSREEELGMSAILKPVLIVVALTASLSDNGPNRT